MEITKNSFEGGLLLDYNVSTQPSNTLSNALNATMTTFNGNEQILQNDMGNVLIPYKDSYAQLDKDYIPIGSKVFGNIMYIASYNPNTKRGQIGSFPSPDYSLESGKLLYRYQPLHVLKDDYELDTTYFNFDLEHPVEMIVESSFDNSVNIIFTDGKNEPRLINSGFVAREDNSFEIIRRFGTNNTNRYSNDEVSFNLQTSLYRISNKIPKITFLGLESSGQLKVGSYVFYVIACDKDGNETDIICESGVISVFKGTDGDPFSVNGGIENEITDKTIGLTINNIDDAYSYIKLCYTRATSANDTEAMTLAYKIQQVYEVDDNALTVYVTGYEDTVDIDIAELDTQYFNADIVQTQCFNQNLLFQGNLCQISQKKFSVDGKQYNEYEALQKLSLSIEPYLNLGVRVTMDQDYKYTSESKNSYYNSQFCYNYTGYHIGEIYRFGIVYIRSDNSLTSVFDVLGVNCLNSKIEPSDYISFDNAILDNVNIYTDKHQVITDIEDFNSLYNIKGVSRIVLPNDKTYDQLDVIGINFNIPTDTRYLLSSNQYKGYFFVRQKRIPTLLAQAYTTNICEEAYIPTLNLKHNGEKRYLLESFVTGAHYTYDSDLPVQDYYPRTQSGTGKGQFRLRQGYKSRLFTLTDHCKVYFDKLVKGDKNGVTKFWTDILNQDFKGDIWWHNTDSEYFYGDDESETDYYTIVASDGDGTKQNFYHVEMAFFEKLSKESIDTVNSLNLNWVQSAQAIGKDGKAFDGMKEKWTIGKGWSGLKYGWIAYFSDKYYYAEDWSEDTNLSGKTLTTKNGIQIAYDRPALKIGFNPNRIPEFIYPYLDHHCLIMIKDNEYYILTTIFYETSSKQSSINNRMISNLRNYDIYNDSLQTASQDEIVTKELGYDLTIPTYNGKFRYKDGYQKDDYYSYDFMPLEYNSYAAFCPDYELYQPRYNNIFTGAKCVTQYATDEGYLDSRGQRRYTYNNTKITDSKDLSETHVLSVDENISLCSINHNQQIGAKNYIYHDRNAYFSTKIGDSNNSHFKFAGAEFIAYNFPTQAIKDNYDVRSNYVKACSPYKMPEKYPYNIVRGNYGAYLGMFPEKADENFANRIVNIYIPNYNDDDKSLYNYFNLRVQDKSAYQAISDRISLSDYNITKTSEYTIITHGKTTITINKNAVCPKCHLKGQTVTDGHVICSTCGFDLTEAVWTEPSIGSIQIDNNVEDIVINENANTCYRGDCFIGWYTHRINRNFNDGSAPYNDIVIDSTSFYDAFTGCFNIEYRKFDLAINSEAATKLNIGDLNAIQLGSWVTFPVRSSYNISLRSTDDSWTDEKHECGNARSFFPLHAIDASGSYKIPESTNYNQAFTKSGSDKHYFNQNNIIYDNQYYKNRITYSNIRVQSSFENGNRVFLATHYRDYTDQYGAIVKLLSLSGYLIVICEHGIFNIPVNERALASEANGGFIFINTSNVLPQNPNIISDTYGSTWRDSIVQTPYGIYGVDAVAKKIWYTDGRKLTLISDGKVQSFLNDALSMYNSKLSIGKVNIKTHYNQFKNDVMFTAYEYPDDSNDNVLWNICFNINLAATNNNGWQTFYSWIPSESGNIGNNFITFNHEVDRNIIDSTTFYDTYDDDYIKSYLSINYIYKHGQSEFVPNTEKIKPTFWYGRQHPFEFEIAINEKPDTHKIFNNLRILSNKAEPESFHYEVVGECYDLDGTDKILSDKPNMYYRQELTKAFYQLCEGSKIRYNPNFLMISPKYVVKSTIFPLYYAIKHDYNLIEDYYSSYYRKGYEYADKAGAEILYNELLNEFRIVNHVQGVDLAKYGRLRGNMHYREDGWYVQIPTINYMQENEYLNKDFNGKLAITVGNNPIPYNQQWQETSSFANLNNKLGLKYDGSTDITFDSWGSGRKEMRLKDKFAKIKIRYSGKDLAVIQGILTLYTISYS